MILRFLDFLSKSKIDYRVTNGYETIFKGSHSDADYDILFQKSDFSRINSIIDAFSHHCDYKIVQVYHQGIHAKNFFIYDERKNQFLNLDLYGELSRQGIKILNEVVVFETKAQFKGISILRSHQEFIQYFIKKIDKEDITEQVFKKLTQLFEKQEKECGIYLKNFFNNTHLEIAKAFEDKKFNFSKENTIRFKNDFITSQKNASTNKIRNRKRILSRIIKPTGIAIAFLGPDGSGKSTIIDGLIKQILPYRKNVYFHLKPIVQSKLEPPKVVTNPHEFQPYSPLKSFVKLVYFIFQYNIGWIKNIIPLRIKSSLIIFDRYYDDVLVDHKRYRYGGNKRLAKFIRSFIPRPELYFILTTEAIVISKRKQEVPLEELQRQIKGYRSLGDNKRYFNIDVNRTPEEIVSEITKILMQRMNERY